MVFSRIIPFHSALTRRRTTKLKGMLFQTFREWSRAWSSLYFVKSSHYVLLNQIFPPRPHTHTRAQIHKAIKRMLYSKWNTEVHNSNEYYCNSTNTRLKDLPKSLLSKDKITIHQLRTGTSPPVWQCRAPYKGSTDENKLCPHGCGVPETVKKKKLFAS